MRKQSPKRFYRKARRSNHLTALSYFSAFDDLVVA